MRTIPPVAALQDVSVYSEDNFDRILNRVTLEVQRGEILGVLGPAGSGKSTVLRLLAGRQRAAAGHVKVFGRSPRWPSVKARLGYLPALNNRKPSGFFSSLGRLFSKPSTNDKSSQAALYRLNLARILNKDFDLIILDEPFASLEPAIHSEIKNLILTLAKQGKSIVITSDSLDASKSIYTRMSIFYGGRIQAAGTLEQLLASPQALAFLAPLLSPDSSKRVLDVIREEAAKDIEDKVLLRLSESNTALPSVVANDPIDHEKLSALARPVSRDQAPPKP